MTTKKKNTIKKDLLKKAKKLIIKFNKEKTSENEVIEKEYTALEYESMRDDAMEMARVLREIDKELRDAAMTDLREDCGYPPKMLLANLCKIMYSCYVNFDHEIFK